MESRTSQPKTIPWYKHRCPANRCGESAELHDRWTGRRFDGTELEMTQCPDGVVAKVSPEPPPITFKVGQFALRRPSSQRPASSDQSRGA